MLLDKLTAGNTTMTVVAAASRDELTVLRPEIDELLARHGAVLVRGLGLSRPDEFHRAVSVFGDPLTSYRGGNTPRTTVADGVFTSTEYPPEYEISLHNELSYAHRWPGRLYFCCLAAPRSGGATPVCDSRALLADLDPEVRERFRTRGVTYHQFLHGGYGFGKSWQDTFETDDRTVVEKYLREAGADALWTADGDLRTALHRPATREHPVTGEAVWFNQADQWHLSNLPRDQADVLLAVVGEEDLPHRSSYGDGSPIETRDIAAVHQAADRHRLSVAWHAGDLMLIDNMLVMHGREAFTGQRRVLVSMT